MYKNESKIEWTGMTWNNVVGCDRLSEGCDNCYAKPIAEQLQAKGYHSYRNGFQVTLQPQRLNDPEKWDGNRLVFVNSMSDLYHKLVPTEYIQKTFEVMNRVNRHQYQILTKRPERLLRIMNEVTWSPNIWQGVSVELAKYKHRINLLREVPAKIRFLSLEPLLGSLGELDLTGILWVIAGGESGPNARPMEADWVREIRDQCAEQNVPFFFKQWGGVDKYKTGNVLDGRQHLEFPEY